MNTDVIVEKTYEVDGVVVHQELEIPEEELTEKVMEALEANVYDSEEEYISEDERVDQTEDEEDEEITDEDLEEEEVDKNDILLADSIRAAAESVIAKAELYDWLNRNEESEDTCCNCNDDDLLVEYGDDSETYDDEDLVGDEDDIYDFEEDDE